jgi:uncharacterized protein (DUF362 family)
MSAKKENRVHLQKCAGLSHAVKNAMEAIDWENIVPIGTKVAIKVNMCDSIPKKGVITTPELVFEVIKILKDKECKVTIVESDGLLYSADAAYRETEMQKWVEKAGAHFVNLTNDEKRLIYPKNTLFVKEYAMPKTLKEADVLITMPLLKTHEITLYTGALKNQFGCYPQHNRVMLHAHLDEAIVDINTILKPDIVIMDALTAIEGNGPTRGYPVKMDLLIVSNNPVSCDLAALEIMGFDVNEVGHVKLARDLNGGADDYVLTGESIESVKREFKRPYDDLGNKAQKFILKHKILTKILFDTRINRTVVRVGRIYRKWALKGKTEYF